MVHFLLVVLHRMMKVVPYLLTMFILLPHWTTLLAISVFGEVLKVIIVTDATSGLPKGVAYIKFTCKKAADCHVPSQTWITALQHQHERLNQFEDRLTDIQEKIAPIQLISDTLQKLCKSLGFNPSAEHGESSTTPGISTTPPTQILATDTGCEENLSFSRSKSCYV